MVKVWARYNYENEIEVCSEQEHKEFLEREARTMYEDWGAFNEWLEGQYSLSDIWQLTDQQKEAGEKEWEQYCLEYVADNDDEWQEFEVDDA